ncbi:MAG: hypothetical protein ACRDTR_10645 [Rubrobacter sp.]
MTQGRDGSGWEGHAPGRKRRVITAAAVVAAMMAAQEAYANYAQATPPIAPPPCPTCPPDPPPCPGCPSEPPVFTSKKECKQFYKQDGKLTKSERKMCKQMFPSDDDSSDD